MHSYSLEVTYTECHCNAHKTDTKRTVMTLCTSKTATNQNNHRLKWPQSETKTTTLPQQIKSFWKQIIICIIFITRNVLAVYDHQLQKLLLHAYTDPVLTIHPNFTLIFAYAAT